MSYLDIFKNRSVLVTGHTGFKGSWLAIWLQQIGAKVFGVALDPPSKPSHFEAADMKSFLFGDNRLNIQDCESFKLLISQIQPDFVFHLAAQSLVRRSFLDPVETYKTNLLGTLNLLEGLRLLNKPCNTVLITSDKSYNNVEWVWGYRETDELGGPDPYSASKGATEFLIRSHIKSFFPLDGPVRIAIGRAGNVIGGGDWAANRIVPDCVRSWASGSSVELRNPNSTRPWQHVLEPLSGYLTLARELSERPELHGEPFNFGPPANQNYKVLELVQEMSKHWDKVRWEEDEKSNEHHYESGLLKLNCDKALHHLKWQAVLSFEETVKLTTEWYQSYYNEPKKIINCTINQINEYNRFINLRLLS